MKYLTDLEYKVLKIVEDYYEETEECLIPIITKELKLTVNQLKGVLGSLVKKEYIIVADCNEQKTLLFNDDMRLLIK